MKDSQTCIDASSEYTPINFAVHRENFNIEDDGKFAVPEDSDIFTPWAVRSRRKPLHGYESIIASLSSSGKTVPCDRSFTSSGKPVQRDESVVGVERRGVRTQIDRDQSSVERSNLREILAGKAEIAIEGEKRSSKNVV